MMIDSQWWEATSGAIEVIIDCLPKATQEKIRERLQLLAQVQANKGLDAASIYSRMVSGEPFPEQQAKPKSSGLRVVVDNSAA